MKRSKSMIKVDFSQKAIQKAVKNKILQSPVSLYTISLGMVGIIAAGLILPNPVLLGISAGVISAGLLNTAVNYLFRKDKIESKHITHLNRLLIAQKQKVLMHLKKGLAKYKTEKGLEVYADQAVKQFEKIQKKFDNFKSILSEKFFENEIFHGRFLGTTEQLYLSVLDNLEDILNSLTTISNIDDSYIVERLTYLNGLKELEEADKREALTLKARKQLKDKQLERINELLTINEEAMTQIDITMTTICELKTKSGRAQVDMEIARKDLEELVLRTKRIKKI